MLVRGEGGGGLEKSRRMGDTIKDSLSLGAIEEKNLNRRGFFCRASLIAKITSRRS